jgi:LysM repeat protein
MAVFSSKNTRWIGAGFALTVMIGCLDTLDYDLRGDIGGGLDTTTAAQTATAQRPEPDDRGVISYPSYQVVVAKRGDTLGDISQRVGIPAEELSKTNGIAQHVQLREGEVITLPRRIAEPSAATGGTGVVTAPGGVDIASLAGGAINNADTGVETETLQPEAASASQVQTGVEPVRHKVKRGETAFTIARLYNVSVRSLAEWNGLGSDFTIRENQILLIPPVDPQAEAERKAAAATAASTTTKPGEGSPTPTPPSASKPLPEDNTVAAATPVAKPESPNLNEQQSASKAAMSYPVSGKVIRPYSKGKNNGIDIAADAGTPVTAANYCRGVGNSG